MIWPVRDVVTPLRGRAVSRPSFGIPASIRRQPLPNASAAIAQNSRLVNFVGVSLISKPQIMLIVCGLGNENANSSLLNSAGGFSDVGPGHGQVSESLACGPSARLQH